MAMSTLVGDLDTAAPRPVARGRVRAFIALTKPRIIELLLITTVPTMVVAQRGLPPLGLVAVTVAGGTLAAAGANAINMWWDRDIDARMRRTAHRPLVQGTISPPEALVFALALEAAAFIVLATFVNLLAAGLALGAAAFYFGIYTMWLKRSSSSNIVIGGAAGAVPVLVGWAAVTGRIDLAPLVMFAIIFVWTPPHFWALAFKYREDYRAAEVPMLPAVASFAYTAKQIVAYTVVLWVLSLVLAPVAHLGLIYWVAAVVGGGLFTAQAIRLLRARTERAAMALFHGSITYLTVLFTAMAVDQLLPLS